MNRRPTSPYIYYILIGALLGALIANAIHLTGAP